MLSATLVRSQNRICRAARRYVTSGSEHHWFRGGGAYRGFESSPQGDADVAELQRAQPSTLDVYSHLLPGMQEEAAQKVDAALKLAFEEQRRVVS